MRHGKKFNHLGRKAGHRKAMLRNMASSLILHKRITTTTAKAKELRKYIEPVITKSKTDGMASRRLAFRYLQDKTAVHELFTVVSGKIAERDGGYTRIIKLGNRLGDNAETALIELVDFNELYTQSKSKSTGKRRRRRGGKSNSEADTQVESQDKSVVEDVAVEEAAPVVEEELSAEVDTVEETAVEVEEDSITEEAEGETPEAETDSDVSDEATGPEEQEDSTEEEKKPEQ